MLGVYALSLFLLLALHVCFDMWRVKALYRTVVDIWVCIHWEVDRLIIIKPILSAQKRVTTGATSQQRCSSSLLRHAARLGLRDQDGLRQVPAKRRV